MRGHELARQEDRAAARGSRLLSVLLRRAGEIFSCQRLAATLGISADALDRRVQALREALMSAGSACLLYAVESLGSVPWRG